MADGTTFHFLEAAPAKALETARAAADGQDVRIGGGPTVVRDFLAAGLVDHMHVVQVPILLGWNESRVVEADMSSPHAAASPQAQTPPAARTAKHPDTSDARPHN